MQLAVRKLRTHLIFESIIEYTIQYYDTGSLFRNLLILVINYPRDVATIIISDIIASPFALIQYTYYFSPRLYRTVIAQSQFKTFVILSIYLFFFFFTHASPRHNGARGQNYEIKFIFSLIFYNFFYMRIKARDRCDLP